VKAFFIVLLIVIYIWACLAVFTLGVVLYRVYYWLTGSESAARDLALLTFSFSPLIIYAFSLYIRDLCEKSEKGGEERCAR